VDELGAKGRIMMRWAKSYRPSGAPKVRAIPAGGTCKWCWGRTFSPLLILLAAPLWAQDLLPVPSGQPVTLFDIVADDAAPGTKRFRYLAPELGQAQRGFHEIADDFPHLCKTQALPQLQRDGDSTRTVVISLMQSPVDFGVMTPDVVQFFESFTIENDLCIWEAF
jgi:hypothetical protein